MELRIVLLKWNDILSWRTAVLDVLIRQLVPARNVAWLRSLPSPSGAWDDSSRLLPIMKEFGQEDLDEVSQVMGSTLGKVFSHVCCFHLCRPAGIESYRKHGVVPMCPLKLQRDIIEHFTATHPELSEEDLQAAIAQVPVEHRMGKVFVGLDRRFLVEQCGHYLVYGSEYVLAVSRHIRGDGKTDYSQSLKGRGRSAIVIAHIPLALISDQSCAELSIVLMEAALWSLQLEKENAPSLDFGIEIPSLPPDLIYDIVDTAPARDPFERS